MYSSVCRTVNYVNYRQFFMVQNVSHFLGKDWEKIRNINSLEIRNIPLKTLIKIPIVDDGRSI